MKNHDSLIELFRQQMFASETLESLEFSDREAGVDCPNCQQSLSIATMDDTKIAACRSCKGMLFQMDVLAFFVRSKRAEYKLDDVTPEPLNSNDLEIKRNCPACWQSFDTHPYYGPGNVVIDSCRNCQLIWLDQGEFSTIIKAPGQRNAH